MTDRREAGLQVMREMLPGVFADGDIEFRDGSFADEFMELGLDAVFGTLWTREGLSRRDRSLLTLGILIAQRSSEELKSHFQIALANGLTRDELAEVVYHATGYAGYPAAATARNVAIKAFEELGG